MKRMMIAALLLVSTASVFAADQKSERKDMQKEETKIAVQHVVKAKDECSVTLEATIGPDFAKIKVSCTYSAATCRAAYIGAKTCIDEARKAIM